MTHNARNDSPAWSLITVTFNSSAALRTFWSTPPKGVEWIVVDNNSSDDTVATAKALGASVIELPENIGFGAANNVGFAAAEADLIGFINPDVTVDYDTLPHLGSIARESECLVAPQLLNADGTLQPNGRGFPLVINKLRNRTGGLEKLRDQYLLYAAPGQRREVCWLIGAVVIGQRQIFEKIGRWDERFFIYYEDSDICLRAWRDGIPSVLDGDANWVHGWARETTGFKWAPWKREIASMTKFYSRYPVLVLGNRLAARRFPKIAAGMRTGGWTWSAPRP